MQEKQELKQSKPECKEEPGQISPPAQTKVEFMKFILRSLTGKPILLITNHRLSRSTPLIYMELE